jgi:hypothetical protein
MAAAGNFPEKLIRSAVFQSCANRRTQKLKPRFPIPSALAARTPRLFFGGGHERNFCPRSRRGFARRLGRCGFARSLEKKRAAAGAILARPGWQKNLSVRSVPPPPARPAFLAHPRLRRAGTMSQHTVAAALEALGEDAAQVQSGALGGSASSSA